MTILSLKQNPLVIGNTIDQFGDIDQAFAMEVEQIPYFINEFSNKPSLMIYNIQHVAELVVNYGEITYCRDELFLEELNRQLVNFGESKFEPICVG